GHPLWNRLSREIPGVLVMADGFFVLAIRAISVALGDLVVRLGDVVRALRGLGDSDRGESAIVGDERVVRTFLPCRHCSCSRRCLRSIRPAIAECKCPG